MNKELEADTALSHDRIVRKLGAGGACEFAECLSQIL
jgi:hypothetical protein